MPSDRVHELRRWAFGDNSRSAAIELLLHTDLIDEAYPWVVHDRAWGTWAIDFDAVTEALNGLAVEHRAWNLTPSRLTVLRIAASLADNAPIQLHALLPTLEYGHTELVMIAIAHSAGYTRFTLIDDVAARSILQPRPPLATWPDDTTTRSDEHGPHPPQPERPYQRELP